MLGRRGANRRNRHLRDRGETPAPLSPHPARVAPVARPPPPAPPDNKRPVTFVWPDPAAARRAVVLVASFDGHLHHKMRPAPCAPRAFSLTLRVPPGRHTFKFLVDGVWSTHPALHPAHPIELTDDGVKHHRLVVDPPSPPDRHHAPNPAPNPAPIPAPIPAPLVPNAAPLVTLARLNDAAPPAAVFRSSSASAVPSPVQIRDRVHPHPACTPAAYDKTSASVSLHDTSRRPVDIAPRGSSFNAPPTVGGISHMQAVNRKSLLQRVGAGWLRRFSNRMEEDEPACTASMSNSQFVAAVDRSAGAIFKGKDRPALFPSSSDPTVGRSEGKENAFKSNKASAPAPALTPATPDRCHSRRANIRGSSRNTAVKVSRPMKVDEPKDVDEVNRQADNWRHMARHLQENLFDPTGARELFTKAIQHREKHGLWCTSQNAQVHVDLARNLSKAEQMKDAEFHLRIALRIYNHIDAGREHIADLMLYVGVVVDRQKRRTEAEDLYRKALTIYKENKFAGNNVDIAVKNLSLNLRKQNREHDIDAVRKEFSEWKKAFTRRP